MLVALLLFAANGGSLAASAPGTEEAEKLRAVLDAPPPNPKEHTRPQLAQIYLQRGKAAMALGESERAIKEFNAGIQIVGPKFPPAYDLYQELAHTYLDRGDLRRGVEARKAALAVAQGLGRQLLQTSLIGSILSNLGEREEAKKFVERAEGLVAGGRGHPGWDNFGNLWTARAALARGHFAQIFGYLNESERAFRLCITSIRTHLRGASATDSNYFYLVDCTRQWMNVAIRQGRLREAGAFLDEYRQITEKYASSQGRPLFVSRMAPQIARVYIEQGLLKEAGDVIGSTIAHYGQELQRETELEEANPVLQSRRLAAAIEILNGNWQKAAAIYSQMNRRSVERGYTLLRIGQRGAALKMFETILERSEKLYDEDSLYLWEHRAFHALAAGAARAAESAKTLAQALPKILERSRPEGTSGEAGLLNTARLNWLIEGYLALLSDLHKSGARIEGMDLVDEAFRYADIARASRVQGALSQAILRASTSDPTVASAIRRAQDLEYLVKATAEYLTALQARESGPDQEKLITAKRAELDRLRAENEQAQQELKRKLPDYAELLNPKPLDIAGAQKLLRPNEALISIYSTAQRTLIWAVPAQGQASFATLEVPSSAIAETVGKLRKSLDPSEVDAAQLPTFDFASAHDLYNKLLVPVEAGWRGATELLVVPHGSLSELPFSVLVTAGYTGRKAGLPFAEHGDAPWLLKKAAISYLPSVAGLAGLRRGAARQASRAFVGIGDPVFSATRAASVGRPMASRGIQRRNLTLTRSSAGGHQSLLELLQPLPDTHQEVREIGRILRADENRDLYLAARASEQTVKAADLSQYRVVMFATHGLVPGELPGLRDPALALSNPAVTGEKEDGLLTLAEILGLKFNADWVVLSACNTASPDGQASEAVSGLGRAFFYAGAKALLVSHWPVETVSAKLLTTELFKRQAGGAKLSRAQAMREASLAVMRQSAGKSYSYAHPMFWAPFVVVGDGG
jgi:CHAT domain-containing protein